MTRHRNKAQANQRLLFQCVAVYVVCSLAHPGLALGQEQDRVSIDARSCLALESPAERLACFEAQVDDARSREPTGPKTVGAPPPSPEQPIPAVDVARVAAEGAPADAPQQTEWIGSVASLQERAPNQYLITLDNGQVWQQRGAQRYRLRVGQHVRIYETRFGGGLRLQADGVNGFITVDRVR